MKHKDTKASHKERPHLKVIYAAFLCGFVPLCLCVSYECLNLDFSHTQLFAGKPADELVEGFGGGRKDERVSGPIQLEARGLSRYPDLPGVGLGADHDLAAMRFLNFDGQHAILEQDFRAIFFGDDIERAIQFLERGVAA